MRNASWLALCLLLPACKELGGAPGSEPPAQETRRVTEVPFDWLSAEAVRFDPPVRAGARRRVRAYAEALVLRLAVDAGAFDALPPDVEAFLYVGTRELRPFRVERPARDEREGPIVLTFHDPRWEELEDRAPMVLTIDHGAPVREPERFLDAPRFQRERIVDRR